MTKLYGDAMTILLLYGMEYNKEKVGAFTEYCFQYDFRMSA